MNLNERTDMNRGYSLIILCLLLWGDIACQKETDIGLVAYYPFSGDARDHSGNENHGSVDGSLLTADRFEQENSAFHFDGEKAMIEAHVKGMPAIDSPQSLSWWFRVETDPTYNDDFGADNMIALVDSGKGIGIQFGFRGPGYKSRGFDTWNWGGGTLLETEQPTLKKWHHCVYTYDGLNHRFYINSNEMSNSTKRTQQDTPTLLMFGNYPSGDQYFAGDLDDVRIYNRTLNQHEITILFNEGK
jgi:hypothetical protein